MFDNWFQCLTSAYERSSVFVNEWMNENHWHFFTSKRWLLSIRLIVGTLDSGVMVINTLKEYSQLDIHRHKYSEQSSLPIYVNLSMGFLQEIIYRLLSFFLNSFVVLTFSDKREKKKNNIYSKFTYKSSLNCICHSSHGLSSDN